MVVMVMDLGLPIIAVSVILWSTICVVANDSRYITSNAPSTVMRLVDVLLKLGFGSFSKLTSRRALRN